MSRNAFKAITPVADLVASLRTRVVYTSHFLDATTEVYGADHCHTERATASLDDWTEAYEAMERIAARSAVKA